MNDPYEGSEVIVCLYHQQKLVMTNMYLQFWLFRDYSLHRCCYGEELVYWWNPVLNL